MPESVRHRDKKTQHGTEMFRCRTETQDVGMPNALADYNLTLSRSRLRSHRSQAFHLNDDECRRTFPNYSKMEQPIGKGRVRGRGGS
jgi:hypothetical protein